MSLVFSNRLQKTGTADKPKLKKVHIPWFGAVNFMYNWRTVRSQVFFESKLDSKKAEVC